LFQDLTRFFIEVNKESRIDFVADFNPQCSDKRVSLVISANYHYMKFWTVIRSTLTLETCEESFSEPELFLDLG